MSNNNESYREDLDHYADKYLHPNAARTVDQRCVSILADRIIPILDGPNVLEMGYGDGVWTNGLIQRFEKSFVVDASAQLLKVASSIYGDKLTMYQSYFEEFHSPILFDSVICTYVLEHVVDPVVVLRQCRNWLKPHGMLCVAVPNATSLHRRLGVRMGLQKDVHELNDMDVKIGHRRIYDGPMLEADLASAGFRVDLRLTTMCKPLPNAILAPLNDAQLEGLFDLGDELPEDQRSILAYTCRPA
jgi:trans-aconitate methyltransferase